MKVFVSLKIHHISYDYYDFICRFARQERKGKMNFLKRKNEAAKEALLQTLKALDVMPEMWRARHCSFKTDIRVDVDEQYGELQLHICRTVKGRDADLSRSPLAYRCSGLKAMPAKENLRMIGASEGLVARYEAVYEVNPRSMRASDIRVAVAALC